MIYSKTCEYAIRALLFLASRPKGEYVLTHIVSKQTGVPQAYLAKIFRDLAHHKILLSKRGAVGGVTLAAPAEEISLQRIVEVIDDPEHFQSCVMGLDQCSDRNACPLHHIWSASRKKITAEMRKCSLAAITKKIGKAHYRQTKRGRLNLELYLSNAAE